MTISHSWNNKYIDYFPPGSCCNKEKALKLCSKLTARQNIFYKAVVFPKICYQSYLHTIQAREQASPSLLGHFWQTVW